MDDQFIDLCTNGKLDEAKKLYESTKINIYAIPELTWSHMCYHLSVAKWLYSLTSIHVDRVFKYSCESGYLDVAQWLYSLGNIDIRIYGEHVFIVSCRNGHLNVVQWLHSLGGINIHARNDEAFILCFYNMNIEIIRWLLLIEKFDNSIVDEYTPVCLHEYAFNLGYLPVEKMETSYVKYKNKIREKIKEKNKTKYISIFEIDDLINIIVAYI